jgi:hypothetical protein
MPCTRLSQRTRLFEEFLVDPLDVNGLLDPTAHVVPDHQGGKLSTIDQYDALTQKLREGAQEAESAAADERCATTPAEP